MGDELLVQHLLKGFQRLTHRCGVVILLIEMRYHFWVLSSTMDTASAFQKARSGRFSTYRSLVVPKPEVRVLQGK